LIANGVVSTSGTVGLTATPSLYTNPPVGYSKGNQVMPVAGTWAWDGLPPGVN
jgi:hypothetical protein